MELSTLQNLLSILSCVELTVLIAISVGRLSFRRSMAPVFFTFALVSLLMSGLYWLAYDLLRPDTRMPFAANEFGEIGGFLLLASALNAVFRGRFADARREIVCAAVFAAASTALWIGWSGEWVEDVLVLTLTVSSLPVTGHDGSGTATMGSFLLEEKAGGIFAVVVLAFLFGVLITLLCIRKRKTPEKAEKTMDSQYVENGGNQT